MQVGRALKGAVFTVTLTDNQTGKSIEIAASNAVKFKPGKALRDSVNE